jgi:hypothetical protein
MLANYATIENAGPEGFEPSIFALEGLHLAAFLAQQVNAFFVRIGLNPY